MNVIRETYVFFHHFERTEPRWWCVDSYESYKSSIQEYSSRKPLKRYASFISVEPFKFVRCVSNGERLHRQRYFIEALVCVTFYRRKLLKSKRLHNSREAVLFGNHRG